MSTTRRQQEEKQQPALSRELSEFLVAFSIAAHRFAMYPPEHPSLLPAIENVISALASLLRDRGVLSLGIAQHQIVIDQTATDERHPVLSDLARRLHAHQLGAVAFSRGVTLEEFANFLGKVAEEPERGGNPLGLLPESERPTWEHIAAHPIGYDQLEFAGRGGKKDVPGKLWLRLARAALGDAVDESDLPGIEELAKLIREKKNDAQYDKAIVGILLQLSASLKGIFGAEAEEIRRQLSELLRELDEETLQRMVRLGGERVERRRLVQEVNRGKLSVDAVMKILRAVAAVEEKSISSSLARLLSKLSHYAEQGAGGLRAGAEHAVRDSIDQWMANWDLEAPNPDAYTQLLDRMTYASPVFEGDPDGQALPGAERILQIAIEVDAFGPTVEKALSDLLDRGEVPRILKFVDRAPPGNRVAERLRQHLMTPAQLRRLLSGGDVDEESLRLLVERIGEKAIDPLFQFLAESESRHIRQTVFEVLAAMKVGKEKVTAMAVTRTRDERWYVKRNMLALLQELEVIPPDFSPISLLQYHDPRVRREAFPVAIRMPAIRDRALFMALGDEDERVVRMGLIEAQKTLPDSVVPMVTNRLLGSEIFPTLRSLAVRALESTNSPLALEALLGICSSGKTIFGRPKLAPKSPELLVAIGVLARKWSREKRASGVLELAESSPDLQISKAASYGGVRP